MKGHSPTSLFERFFWPLYPPDARADLEAARTKDANPGDNPALYAALEEIATLFERLAPKAMQRPDLVLDRSDASIHRLSAALDRKLRDRWAEENADDGVPMLAHFVIHGAIYVGSCAVRNHGGTWRVRRPLWESLVRLTSPAGEADLAVFHWWLKSLSDGEIDRHTLADRYRAHVEEPTRGLEQIAPILPDPRRIPRLAKVRYDTLHKHLRAHLPELSDLGAHFPTADRFAELGFAWLDFTWLAGGKLLLVHGPARHGVHLIWLDRAGFVKAAYYPADQGTSYALRIEGDLLEVTVVALGETRSHTMLFWGP